MSDETSNVMLDIARLLAAVALFGIAAVYAMDLSGVVLGIVAGVLIPARQFVGQNGKAKPWGSTASG